MSKMSAKHLLSTLTVWVTTLVMMAGCDVIDDHEGDCSTTYKVEFHYTYNLKYADAFAHEVNAVHLYVLDEDDNIVWEGEEQGDALSSDNYQMTLDIAPGTYRMIAWCTENKNNSYYHTGSDAYASGASAADDAPSAAFVMPDSARGDLADLGVILNGRSTYGNIYESTYGSTFSTRPVIEAQHELDYLYHGMLTSVTLPDTPGVHIVEMPLVRDTKYMRVILEHLDGSPVDADDFTFTITADNGLLSYDNTVIPGHDVLYHPFNIEGGQASIDGGGTTVTGDSINVAKAEFTTSRLVTQDAPRLTVTTGSVDDDTYRVVFSVPLLDYFLLLKPTVKNGTGLSDQEYLDRQDEYNMTFFLDKGDRWVSNYIYINSWRVVHQLL